MDDRAKYLEVDPTALEAADPHAGGEIAELLANVEFGEERKHGRGSRGSRVRRATKNASSRRDFGRDRPDRSDGYDDRPHGSGQLNRFNLYPDLLELANTLRANGGKFHDVIELMLMVGNLDQDLNALPEARIGVTKRKKGARRTLDTDFSGKYVERARDDVQYNFIRSYLAPTGRMDTVLLGRMLDDFGHLQRYYGRRCPRDFSEREPCVRVDCPRRHEGEHFHFPPTDSKELDQIGEHLVKERIAIAEGRPYIAVRPTNCRRGNHHVGLDAPEC